MIKILLISAILLCGIYANSPALHVSIYDTDDCISLGETTYYIVSVRNEGTKNCTQVVLKNYIPATSELVNVKDNLEYEFVDGCVVFSPIASLAPGEKISFGIRIKSTQLGFMKNSAVISCHELPKHITIEEITCVTATRQHWALHFSGYDTEDPIFSVGDRTTYVVEVRNEGQQQCQNVVIRNVLPQGVKLQSASSSNDNKYHIQDNAIIFSPVTIQPGEKITYKITASFEKAGFFVNTSFLEIDTIAISVRKQEGTVVLEKEKN